MRSKTPKREITLRLPIKEATKLLSALESQTYQQLTKAEAATLSEFLFELRCQVMQQE